MIPNRVRLSKRATNKLQNMKVGTGLTPNILSRIAIMLAIKSSGSLNNAGVEDSDGQELNKVILFGDYIDVYEILIRQYMHDYSITMTPQQTIAALVEIGVHKMGHVKNISDIYKLGMSKS